MSALASNRPIRALIDRAERRLKNLNYFKTVKITNEPGSAPDRIVVMMLTVDAATRRPIAATSIPSPSTGGLRSPSPAPPRKPGPR